MRPSQHSTFNTSYKRRELDTDVSGAHGTAPLHEEDDGDDDDDGDDEEEEEEEDDEDDEDDNVENDGTAPASA